MYLTSASATTIERMHDRGAADGMRHRHMTDIAPERASDSDEDTKHKQIFSWSYLSSAYKWLTNDVPPDDEEENPPHTADGWLQLWFDRLMTHSSTRQWYRGLPLEHRSFVRMRIKQLLHEVMLDQDKEGKPPTECPCRRSRLVVQMQVGELARRSARATCRACGVDSPATLEKWYTQGQCREGVDPDVLLLLE
jgi:hypothetical protein